MGYSGACGRPKSSQTVSVVGELLASLSASAVVSFSFAAAVIISLIFQFCSGGRQYGEFLDDDPVGSGSSGAFLVEQILHSWVVHGHERVLQVKISFHYNCFKFD